MTVPLEVLTVPGAGAPTVTLLTAGVTASDLAGLRAWARSQTPGAGSSFAARSYRFPYALVACHSTPVGVDIERHDVYPEGFAASVCTPGELLAYRRSTLGHADLTALWCSKEALAKALGDAVQYDPRRLTSPLHWPGGRAGPWRAWELSVPEGHVAWLCWRERP